MDPNTFPTKGNLILAKNSLVLAKQGYELMDKKRNILIRELMELIAEATDIQEEIDTTFSEAYAALQKANIQMGIHEVEQIALSVRRGRTPHIVWLTTFRRRRSVRMHFPILQFLNMRIA